MNWVDALVNQIGNNLLPITGNNQVGIIADKYYSSDNNIIYSYDQKELMPQNQSTLFGFHIINSISGNESRQSKLIKGQNYDIFLSLIITGNQDLDRDTILNISRIISISAPNCKGSSNAHTQVIEIIVDTPNLIDAHFKQYKDTLIQKQTGLRVYEVKYKINANTQF